MLSSLEPASGQPRQSLGPPLSIRVQNEAEAAGEAAREQWGAGGGVTGEEEAWP